MIIGDNSIAKEKLRSIVERVEALEAEKKAIGDDIRDVYAEAKVNGFDTKVLRQVVKIRAMERAAYEEQMMILELYLHSLGVLMDPSKRQQIGDN